MGLQEFNKEFDALFENSDQDGLFDVPLTENTFPLEKSSRFGLRFSYEDLEPAFAKKVKEVLKICDNKGYVMVPYVGLRDVWEQARLWRQSRSTATVNAAMARLENNDGKFLAAALRDVGPQNGPWRTNALPGFSWHQHGKAVDAYRLVGGEAKWDCEADYKVYAETARDLGLTAGYYWTSRDCVHIQAEGPSSPAKVYTIKQINDLMEDKFGTASEFAPLVS